MIFVVITIFLLNIVLITNNINTFLVIFFNIFAATVLYFSFKFQSIKSHRISSKHLSPDEYLKKVDKIISNTKSFKTKNALMITKAEALLYKGNFNEAKNLLEKINIHELPSYSKALYYNNYLFLLIQHKDVINAKIYYDRHKYDLNKESKRGRYSNAIKHTLASYFYLLGDLEKSKKLLYQINSENISKINQVELNYLSCLIKIKEGKTEEAKEMYEELTSFAPEDFYLNVAIDKIVKNQK